MHYILDGEHDQDQWHYSTWDDAEVGHNKAAAMLKEENLVFLLGVDRATGADKTVVALIDTQTGDCNQLADFILFSRGQAFGFTPYVYACEKHLALLKEYYDIAEVKAVPSPTKAQKCSYGGMLRKEIEMDKQLRDFTASDWKGLAGAEPFEDGAPPLVSYHMVVSDWPKRDTEDSKVTILVDQNGIWIGGREYWTQLEGADKSKNVATAKALLVVSPAVTIERLLGIGFKWA